MLVFGRGVFVAQGATGAREQIRQPGLRVLGSSKRQNNGSGARAVYSRYNSFDWTEMRSEMHGEKESLVALYTCRSQAAVSSIAPVGPLPARLARCPVGLVHGGDCTTRTRYLHHRVRDATRAAGRETVREGVAMLSSGTIQRARATEAWGQAGPGVARCEAYLPHDGSLPRADDRAKRLSGRDVVP